MPTKKPRFPLTLDPENHEALMALAKMRGCSAAALVNDLLTPALKPIRALLEAARRAKADPAQTDLEDFIRDLSGLAGKLRGDLADVSNDVEELARGSEPPPLGGSPAARARRAAPGRAAFLAGATGARADASTPVSNTGVTSRTEAGFSAKSPSGPGGGSGRRRGRS